MSGRTLCRRGSIAISLLLFTAIIQAQPAAWWEPAAPIVGQQFTVFYDDVIGALPDGSAQCWLHWGVVDPQSGGWSAPPQNSWPPGSQLSPDGYACQSPMQRGSDDFWQVDIDPDPAIEFLEFVFTDFADNWDNNGGQNWALTFISGEVASWWYPENPLPGDLVTIYYNTIAGTLPNNAQNVKLHWGINQAGAGNWQEPPAAMWPAGTVPWGDNHAVQTPMTALGSGVWSLEIQSNDTTYSLHYVVTDGTNWDNNGSANWNIYLEEPPPLVNTFHTFAYDTRSAFATYGLENINTVSVAGTFNSWSTSANPLSGPGCRGVFSTEVSLPALPTSYKFVINGSVWLQDPDNPTTDGTSYTNSLALITPDTLPYFTQVEPAEGTIYTIGQSAAISSLLRPADFGPGLSGQPTLLHNGSPVSASYNPTTSLLTANVLLNSSGVHELAFSAQDSAGNIGAYTLFLGAYAANSGFHAIDAAGDDVGDGNYSYPSGSEAADLTYFELTEVAGGDSLAFVVQLADLTVNTRALLQICTQVEGFYFEAPLFFTELAQPDWNGSGVQLCLADPASPAYDPTVHNRLITQRNPVETGAAVQISAAGLAANSFQFTVAIADLEAVLGSYNRGWYFGVYAFLEGFAGTVGHSWEVDALHGGVEGLYDPDAYDALFMDSRELQQTMLSNYSLNRRATLDNAGRGFVLVEPGDIGPNIGSSGPVLNLLTRGAPTILPDQTITGIVETAAPISVTLHQVVGGNEYTYNLPAVSDTFEVSLVLQEGPNTIWAEAAAGGETGVSPAIIFDLQVEQAPQAVISTSFQGGEVTLDASASTEPQSQPIEFLWTADPDNPAPIDLSNPNSAISTFPAPDTPGEYYVDLQLEDPDQNISPARTLATVYADSVHPFDWNESVHWVQEAIVYEIYPRSYCTTHQLSEITDNMAWIADMGYTAIWLMPIYPGPSDHGYEITDYYGIEEDYGTPEDFADLMQAAHANGVKVILDLVINHTSIQHPFMQDALAFGPFSHYYNYYDRDANGNYTYYYDWVSLPNLNYDNPEVWDYFIEVSKWWVQEYDIDGYRCDVAWGPQTRNPAFWIAWRQALKTLKPELLLLAEASSTDFTYFDHRFDTAFDWNLHHEGAVNFQNMFPGPPNLDDLHQVIINYGYSYPSYHYPFRFMENHDEERYLAYNTPDETRLAATLLFSIPGIPMVYAGQEIGTTSQRGQIFWGSDPNNMLDYYYKLVHIRRLFPALSTAEVERLNNSQYSTVYSIGRFRADADPIISVMNFASWSQVVTVTLPVEAWGINPDSTYCLNDLLSGSYLWRTGAQLTSITTSLDAKKARIYAISDSAIVVGVPPAEEPAAPRTFSLEQNFPNPFNQECRIVFDLPRLSRVNLAVYNLLGQRVRLLTDQVLAPGRHWITFDGRGENGALLSSGIYFYRLQADDFDKSRKLILLR